MSGLPLRLVKEARARAGGVASLSALMRVNEAGNIGGYGLIEPTTTVILNRAIVRAVKHGNLASVQLILEASASKSVNEHNNFN